VQLVSAQRELQKQMPMLMASLVGKEAKRLEGLSHLFLCFNVTSSSGHCLYGVVNCRPRIDAVVSERFDRVLWTLPFRR